MSEKIIAALDIGTTGISLLVAEIMEKGARVLGLSTVASRGLKKGVVVNIEEAAHSIGEALREAESATGRKIPAAVLGITGRHIMGFSSTGLIGLRGREITAVDRRLAIESAKNVYMPLDREVLHVLPAEFTLDGQGGITDPVGMSGVRLEAAVHIITAYSQAMQNLSKACDQAGLEVRDMVFGPVATAEAVLNYNDRQQGALLVDIGGGTTDIVFFREGALTHASVLGIGGMHITNDLAIGLKVSVAEAERIKKAAGSASVQALAVGETLEILGQDGQLQQVSRELVAAIIQPRCEELFEMVREEISKVAADARVSGAVLTGGTALLANLSGLAASVLCMPARVGLPQGLYGMNNLLRSPAHAAVVGLAAYAVQRELEAAPCCDRASGVLQRFANQITSAFRYKDFLETVQKKKKGVTYV